MLSGRMLQRMLVLLTAMLMIAGAGTACKKKSKKKGASSQKVEEKADPNKQIVEYGKESIEGDSMIFRGEDKEFFIKATPYKVGVNQVIKFEGNCGPSNKGELAWIFGDVDHSKTQKTGAAVDYAYQSAGTFHVIGTCNNGGASQAGSLTITVSGAVINPVAPTLSNQNNCNSCANGTGSGYGVGNGNGGSINGGVNHNYNY